MTDRFFAVDKCERCGSNLMIRTMSWFTEETICTKCADKETDLKAQIGLVKAMEMEGCGYIPKINEGEVK